MELIIVAVVLGLLVVVLAVLLVAARRRAKAAEEDARGAVREREELEAALPGIRSRAIAQSRSVVTGKVAEQFVPFIEGFGFNPRDLRFIGAPIDYICFDGMTERQLERVVLVEVKTGKGCRLTSRERAIRDAINGGCFAFQTCHVDGSGDVEWVE